MKQWRVSIFFPRKGKRDLLPGVYKNFSEADKAAINLNMSDPRLEAKAEEINNEELGVRK